MRLQRFRGPSLSETMAQIRDQLGPDAVILSTADLPDGGIEVRVALEQGSVKCKSADKQTISDHNQAERTSKYGDAFEGINRIARSLMWHNASQSATENLMEVSLKLENQETSSALAQAIEKRYHIYPFDVETDQPVIFAGPPGTGKSSALAKLAARCARAKRPPHIISTDTRSGAREQMQAFAKALSCPFEFANGLRELEVLVEEHADALIFIDTIALNPFELDELEALANMAKMLGADIISVLEAGIAPEDAEDIASLLVSVGSKRVIVTKLDTARRFGAVLSYGEAGLAFCCVSASPFIGTGLANATPLRLARILIDDLAAESETPL